MKRRVFLAAPGLAVPAVAARITGNGGIPQPLPGAGSGAFIADETRRLGELVRAIGIRAD